MRVHMRTHDARTYLGTALQVPLVEGVHSIPPLGPKLLSLKYNRVEEGQSKAYAPQLRRLGRRLEEVVRELREILVEVRAEALGGFVGELHTYLRGVHVFMVLRRACVHGRAACMCSCSCILTWPGCLTNMATHIAHIYPILYYSRITRDFVCSWLSGQKNIHTYDTYTQHTHKPHKHTHKHKKW
jgi:hypothetical protein